MIVYNFNYTILPAIDLHTPIQQPTSAHYAAMCGAISNPSISVEPYSIDICGHFPSVTDRNVQFLMQSIGSYYSTRRMSLTSIRKFFQTGKYAIDVFFTIEPYVAVPLTVTHYITTAGAMMTRIEFIITSGPSLILGSNIEPFSSLNDILNMIPYHSYQQCVPYVPLDLLLQLKLCVSFHEISSYMNSITKAISIATGQLNVNIMLKGVREGVTTSG